MGFRFEELKQRVSWETNLWSRVLFGGAEKWPEASNPNFTFPPPSLAQDQRQGGCTVGTASATNPQTGGAAEKNRY